MLDVVARGQARLGEFPFSVDLQICGRFLTDIFGSADTREMKMEMHQVPLAEYWKTKAPEPR